MKLGSSMAFAALLTSGPALAQRTDDNAVTQADDAFGNVVGNERLGLYSENEVRGFSPVAAGNVRIEGLYFDMQGFPTLRLLEGSTIRVGIAAQGYRFPAPTGIVDFTLRPVGEGDEALLSTAAFAGPFGTRAIELDAQLPVADNLRIAAGVAVRHDESFQDGDDADFSGIAFLARWRPAANVELRPFWGRFNISDDNATPIVVVADPGPGQLPFLPPRIRRSFYGQEWATSSGYTETFGLLSRAALAPDLEMRAGIFRSRQVSNTDHFDLYLDTDREGRAQHLIIADPPQSAASSSGELRFVRTITGSRYRHSLIAALQGRSVRRLYGGSDAAILPDTRIGVLEPQPEPDFDFSERSTDRVTQWTAALGYEFASRNLGTLSLGLRRTDYRKEVIAPGAPRTLVSDRPWLLNGALAVNLFSGVAAYASYTEGLEESGAAPPEAVNRNEAPPALRTRQAEAGLRVALGPLRIVGGLFDVRKPYFNLDQNRNFTRLGQVRHRGLELSITGEIAPGLNLLAGAVLLDARVSGVAVDTGLIGDRPVGVARTRMQANVDYRLPFAPGLSVDLNLSHFGSRTASADNRLSIPSVTTVNIGARYRFRVGQTPVTARIQVSNLFNTFSWTIAGSGAFGTNAPRRVGTYLAVDF